MNTAVDFFAAHRDGEYLEVNRTKYLVANEIGVGGSSKVYKVFSRSGTQYALKVVNLRGESKGHVANYEAEIRMLQKLRNQPHVIQLIDSEVVTVSSTSTDVSENDKSTEKRSANDDSESDGDEDENGPGKNGENQSFVDKIYMLFEFGAMDLTYVLRHPAVMKPVKGQGALPLHLDATAGAAYSGKKVAMGLNRDQIRYLWREMLMCVDMCHKNSIIHLDLKPSNFVIVDGLVKIIDFGIAKEMEKDATSVIRESPVGTLNFMSPESILGMMAPPSSASSGDGENSEQVPLYKLNRSADVWSLGCMLYQMVYGKAPFAHIRADFRLNAITNPQVNIEFPPLPKHLKRSCRNNNNNSKSKAKSENDVIETAAAADDEDDEDDKALKHAMSICLDRDPKTRATLITLLQHPWFFGHNNSKNNNKNSNSSALLTVTSHAVALAMARADPDDNNGNGSAAGTRGGADVPEVVKKVLKGITAAERADFAGWLREMLGEVMYDGDM